MKLPRKWLRSILSVVVASSVLESCRNRSTSDERSGVSHPAMTTSDVKAAGVFPENGTIISDYTALKDPKKIISASFPSSASILHVQSNSTKAKTNSLALSDVTPTSASMLDSLGLDFVQIQNTDTSVNPLYLTIDSSGNYTVVMYVNSTIGYMFPSSSDLANCYGTVAPVGGQTLPVLNCIDIGPIGSIISDQSRYSNSQYIRSGSYYYYADGSSLINGTTTYYSNRNQIRNGSYYYWPSGSTMTNSYVYYPNGTTAYNNSLQFDSGSSFSYGGSLYYLNGATLRNSNNSEYYPNGSTLISNLNIYYPNGSYLRDSNGNLYTSSGTGNQQQVNFAQHIDASDIYIDSQNGTGSWIGMFQTTTKSSYQTIATSQMQLGLGIGSSGSTMPPPTPTNATLGDVGETTAAISWTSGGGSTSNYVVRFIEKPVSFLPTCVGGTTINGTSTTYSNLKPSTLYALLICAQDGNGLMSSAAIVLAKPGNPVAPPMNVVVGASTTSSVTVSWQSSISPNVTQYKYKFSQAPSVPIDCDGGTTLGNVTSATVGGLDENVVYYVAICAATSGGSVSTPTVVSSKTLPIIPPQVQGLAASSTFPGQLALTWTSGGGNSAQYVVAVGPAATPPTDCNNALQTVTATTATIGGLTPGATYAARICAQSIHGSTASGVVVQGTAMDIAANGLDFAGEMGYINRGVLVPNPITGTVNCPTGYLSYQFLGTAFLDWTAYECYRRPVSGSETALDYGGMFGVVNNVLVANSVSGKTGCPTGFTEKLIISTATVDAELKYCYRTHAVGTPPPAIFGGIYGNVAGAAAPNPATGSMTCAPGFTSTRVFGTQDGSHPNDAPVYMCYKLDGSQIPNPTSLAVAPTSATPTTALTLNWVSGGAGTSGFIVSSLAGSTAPVDCSTGSDVGTATTFTLSNLTANSTYSFRVCAYNVLNAKSSGTTVTGTTSSNGTAAPNPTGLAVSGPTVSTLDVSWQNAGGSTAGFKIASAKGTIAPADCSAGIDVSTATTYQLTGLTSASAYAIRVCAYNSSRINSSGVVVNGTTSTPPGPPEISNLAVAAKTATSISLSWTSGGGTTSGFKVARATGNTPPENCSTGTTNGTATSIAVSGLTAGTSYSFRVCSANSSNVQSTGLTLTVQTNINLSFSQLCAAGGRCTFSGASSLTNVTLGCGGGGTMTAQSSIWGTSTKTMSCLTYAATQCNGKVNCTVKFASTTCGPDPAFGSIKTGDVTVTCSGATNAVSLAFGQPCPANANCSYSAIAGGTTTSMSCSAGTFAVQSATYGSATKTTSCSNYISTQCAGKASCSVVFNPTTCLTDPAIGSTKVGVATMSCH